MPSFYSLSASSAAAPGEIGETAQMLLDLQAAGGSLPETWIIPTAHFEQTRQKLVSREPLYGDWPRLLWESGSTVGYPVQRLAKRLQRPLLAAPSQLPWQTLIERLNAPVVRLVPSLWLGDDWSGATFGQILPQTLCWADAEILETALKQLWSGAVNAKSLAFWSHWVAQQPSHQGPPRVAIAVMIQVVEPARFSGTFTQRANGDIEIAMLRGLPDAIVESCPDLYQGPIPPQATFTWQPGYQERSYAPRLCLDETRIGQSCYGLTSLQRRASEVVDAATEQQLWSFAQRLVNTIPYPCKIVWSLEPQTETLKILQAQRWPLHPTGLQSMQRSQASLGLRGQGAAPGNSIGTALVVSPGDVLPTTAHHHIVIAQEVQPEWLPLLKSAVGVVSERGGMTCHAAVLARELGLPAVVGVVDATKHFETGAPLQIDGDRGLIKPLTALPPNVSTARSPVFNPQILNDLATESQTTIWLNLSQPDLVSALADLPIAGVGLLRSEWLMLPVLERRHPYHWLATHQLADLREPLLNQLRPILHAFAPRPVRYRTLDIRSNEFAQLAGAPTVEANPMLGVRGTFSYRHYSAFYEFELQVLKELQDEGYTNVQVILPFVRTVDEIRFCQQAIHQIGLSQVAEFELWIMAEVPSVLFSLADYVAAGIQGIAIGTHDLTQLVLGIDRDQALFSEHFNETHPAVQTVIKQLMQQADDARLPCCLCGASPVHHPDFVTTMLHAGLRQISVDASALEPTARLIRQASPSR
jgi:pyruvate,water dikinase